jgi:hypothetical protein
MKKSLLAFSLLFITGIGFAQADSNESPDINPSSEAARKMLPYASPEIRLYPNPAKNKITLQVKGFAQGMATVKIIDNRGKLLRQDSRLLISGSEDVVMFLALNTGIYYVLVEQKERVVKKRLSVL